jgi:hypothetical protein
MTQSRMDRSRGLFPLLLAGGGLAVLGYNTWAYCCGYCNLDSFYRLGTAGWSLLGLTVFGAMVWTALHWKNRLRWRQLTCPCGRIQKADWSYCPDCGTSRQR